MPFTSAELSLNFPETKNCLELDRQINKLVNNSDYWRKQFNEEQANASKSLSDSRKKQSQDQNCAKVIAEERGKVISSIADKYSEVDRIRIQTESIQKRNKQIAFGGAILLIGLGIIISFTYKK
jgi:Fe2+ transport system protein B